MFISCISKNRFGRDFSVYRYRRRHKSRSATGNPSAAAPGRDARKSLVPACNIRAVPAGIRLGVVVAVYISPRRKSIQIYIYSYYSRTGKSTRGCIYYI